MDDKLLIIKKIKLTLIRVDKLVTTYNRSENILRDNIRKTLYELLEESYKANLCYEINRKNSQTNMLIKLQMLDFYFQLSYDKGLISSKKLDSLCKNLLDIFILTKAWMKGNVSEKSIENIS